MTSLEKIKICGIRSFGPNEEDMQKIHFQKPMTLILGENGCGKSTIIECLRYLTAQKEPAGKGTFVHDPSLAGKTTVRGFVKLQITDGSGNRIDLCRQLQATRTKKTLTTKSLDNVITRTDSVTKEKQSLSNRCADFSQEISRIFGVSRAILENVIFCSQEDSLWPLETDQKLKEKFDQIFDSDKYNKCVGKVRDKMKKLKENCKISDTELKYLEKNKLMAAEKRRDLAKTKNSINQCEESISKLNTSLVPIDEKLKDINEKEMEMSKNNTLKETKKTELHETEKYLAELKTRIGNEFSGTDEELNYMLNNFNREFSKRQSEIRKIEEQMNVSVRQEAKLAKELMNEQGKLGQLQKEDEINTERINNRNQNLKELAVQLDFDDSSLYSETSVQILLNKVQSEVKNREDKLTMLKEAHAKEECEIQSTLDKLREKALSLQNEVKNKERIIEEKQIEATKIKKQLSEIEQSVSKSAEVESQLSKVNTRIEHIQSSVDADVLKKNIQNTVEERNRTEDCLAEVEKKIKILQQNAAAAAELDIQKDLLLKKEADISRLINKHEDTLRSLLGSVPENNFKTAIQAHIDMLKRQIKELLSKQTRKEKEFTELDMKRKHNKEQLKLKEEQLRSFEEEVYDEIGSDTLEDNISALQSQIDDLQDIRGTLSSSECMFQRYIRALQKTKPCCPLCHRDFTTQDDSQILIEELTAKIREVPSKLIENKNNLEEKQNKFNKLLMLRPKNDQILTLKNEILPKMRSEQNTLECSVKKIRKELDDLASDILSPQTDEAVCLSMQGDMVILDQLQLEKRKISLEINNVETSVGNLRSLGNLDELFREEEKLRTNLKNMRSRLDELQQTLNNHNEKLQAEQALKNSLMEEMNKIHGGSSRKKELSERYYELQTFEIVQLEELDSLKEKYENANRLLMDTISQRNLQKTKNLDEIEKLSESVNNFRKRFQDIQTINNHIKLYETKGIAVKLEGTEKLIKKLEMDINSLKMERDKATKAIDEFKSDLSNQESRKRELEDNLKYREKTRYVTVLKEEVSVLEMKCGNLNFGAILKEKRKLKAEEEKIEREKAVMQGRIGELRVRVEQIENELNNKMFKTVDSDYQQELIKLVANRACAKDLERYMTTMEYAMMKYHKQKMARVNSFIKEYWMRIYQGNDIDFIEIQTDSIETTEKRRNYNYKLVQVKNGARLDLRNRCSAGQKMLASLIIRMALAETFSSNCGILTLDEPTTNLDRKNIKNLAAALKDILCTKQNYACTNFQLIVITHDEKFLKELMDIDIINEYVHVQRNLRGMTRVTTESINGSIPRIGKNSRGDSNYHVHQYD